MKHLVILAGGMGRRLRERLGDLPKPLIPICGKPLLEHQLELAAKYQFQHVTIFAGYRADLIERQLGNGSRCGVSAQYVVEDQPLGTAGAVLAGLAQLPDHFVVLYGDTMINVDLDRIWRRHLASQAAATLLVHPNDHPLDSDLLETTELGWITAFHNRPHPADRWFQNLVNAGLYVLRKSALAPWAPAFAAPGTRPNHGPAQSPLDFGRDLFPVMLAKGARLLAYNSPEYIKDIGTPERYDRVCAECRSGVVQRSGLNTPQPAVFLDRDGTLVREVDNLRSADQLELLPGAAPAIRKLNHHGFRVVLITNQPVIAKGFCTESDLALIHRKLETLLGRDHAFLDRIYYCPHHPEKGFAGERPELKIDCECRKPKPGMIHQAARDLNLDLGASWLIGDSTTDLQTARNAGVQSILVRTGHAGKDGKFPVAPQQTADDLLEAVNRILNTRTL